MKKEKNKSTLEHYDVQSVEVGHAIPVCSDMRCIIFDKGIYINIAEFHHLWYHQQQKWS